MAIFQTVIGDLRKAERELEKQLASVRAAIAAIEGRTSPGPGRKRGRRRLSAAERKAVSKRMRAYWRARRKATK